MNFVVEKWNPTAIYIRWDLRISSSNKSVETFSVPFLNNFYNHVEEMELCFWIPPDPDSLLTETCMYTKGLSFKNKKADIYDE